MSKQVLNKTPAELRYIERSVFTKEVNIQNLCNFELGSQESMNVTFWIIIGFQQEDRQDSQNLSNDGFFRLPVTIAQYIIGTKKYTDAGILLIYDDDDYSQCYAQIKEVFRVLTKNDIHQPYIFDDDDYRSSNSRLVEVGYTLYVVDIRYQQNFTASQRSKVEFNFDGVVLIVINGYALVLTNDLFSVSSDEEKHLDFF